MKNVVRKSHCRGPPPVTQLIEIENKEMRKINGIEICCTKHG